ncbi:MAG: MBOAT family O-acyltransferase [Erysipelotrichaceae bacterium]|nr:MBOAT family O-acyltransferase [Erysipelotrichaceae bacterium]
MQFTDFSFLFGFFPLVYLIYRFGIVRLHNTKAENIYLLIVSLLFYAWGSIQSLILLLIALLFNWISAYELNLLNEKQASQKVKKQALIGTIGINLLILFMYKYLEPWIGGFFSLFGASQLIPKLAMPIGLSFYLFSCMSYVFDVYREKAKPCSFVDFGVFVAFFGRVNMGPIGHYAKFEPQLKSHPLRSHLQREGAALFLQGFAYKILLANCFMEVFNALAGNTTWLGSILHGFAYFFQLYFDFAGYSRMARGLAGIFGFEIPANFDHPYCALSVQDFWRRWHISLTDWFREYVYIPLGGNRVSQKRWLINILIVWLLTGIWHGAQASFIFWGLLQAGMILLERKFLNRYLEKLPNVLRHLYLVLMALISWTIFSSPTLGEGFAWIGRYFMINTSGLYDSTALFYGQTYLVVFVLGILCCTPFVSWLSAKLFNHHRSLQPLFGVLGYGFVFILCLAMLISQTSQTFMYAVF